VAIDSSVKEFIKQRAHFQCEYCLLPEARSSAAHHIEHIIARQHGGGDDVENLALACFRCNRKKGPNLSAIDLLSAETVKLYHPRLDAWEDHFQFLGMEMIGLTPKGRATVRLLGMNDEARLQLRRLG